MSRFSLAISSLACCSSGITSEIAALKEDRQISTIQLADFRVEVDKKIRKAKAVLGVDLAAARSNLLKELRKAEA